MDTIGARAVQSLGIDIANLTTRLAVTQALLEDIQELTNVLDQTKWKMTPITEVEGEGEEAVERQVGYEVTIPGDEFDRLTTVLAFIKSLQ